MTLTQEAHSICQFPHSLLCVEPLTLSPLPSPVPTPGASPLPAAPAPPSPPPPHSIRWIRSLGTTHLPQLEQEIVGTYWVCFTFQFQTPHTLPGVSVLLSLRIPFILFLSIGEVKNWGLGSLPEGLHCNVPGLEKPCLWALCRTADGTELTGKLLGNTPYTQIGGWEEDLVENIWKLLSLLRKGETKYPKL